MLFIYCQANYRTMSVFDIGRIYGLYVVKSLYNKGIGFLRFDAILKDITYSYKGRAK